MRRREQRREIPGGDRVFGVRLERGDHVFRSPGRLARAAVVALGDVDHEALMGAMIGLGWLHPDLDLCAVAPGRMASVDAWREYGGAVLIEMDEADYYPAEVDGIGALLIREWSAWMQLHQEARERADFFPVTMGSPASLRSTSRLDTSAATDDLAI
jgi:hypothetical protein